MNFHDSYLNICATLHNSVISLSRQNIPMLFSLIEIVNVIYAALQTACNITLPQVSQAVASLSQAWNKSIMEEAMCEF